MSQIVRCLMTGIWLCAPLPAGAQSLENIVDAWTRMGAIEVYCPKFYPVNIDYVSRMQLAYEDVARKQFKRQFSEKIVQRAATRRDAEVKAVGARKWCTTWRGVMLREGMTNIWN